MLAQQRYDVTAERKQARTRRCLGGWPVHRRAESHQRSVGAAFEQAADHPVDSLIESPGHPGAPVGLVPEMNQSSRASLLDDQLVGLPVRHARRADDISAQDLPAVGRIADPRCVFRSSATFGSVIPHVAELLIVQIDSLLTR